jgi:hypothetical protein
MNFSPTTERLTLHNVQDCLLTNPTAVVAGKPLPYAVAA